MSDYKIIAEDASHYHVQHPSGSQFKVAKQGLSKSTLSKLDKMKVQHFEDGGESEEEEAAADDSAAASPSIWDRLSAGPGKVREMIAANQPEPAVTAGDLAPASDPYASQPSMIQSPLAYQAPQAPQPAAPDNPDVGPAANPAAAQNPLAGPQGMPGAGGYGALESAVKAKGQHESEGFANQAKAQDEYAARLQDIQAKEDAANAEHAANVHVLQQGIMDGKVDPNRLWNSKSTGGQIGSAIALILGGIAGRGNGNIVLQQLNKKIDDDIASQKIDLGKKETMLSNEYKRHGDLQAAFHSTKAYAIAALQAQIQKAALQSGSQTAIDAAKITNGQLEVGRQQNQAAAMQQATQKAIAAMGSYGGVQEGSAIDRYQLQDPKAAERRVVVGGRAYQASGGKDAAESLNSAEAKYQPIIDATNRLSALGKAAVVPGTQANQEAHSIIEGLATSIAGLKSAQIGSKRISDTEAEHAVKSIMNPTALAQLANGKSRNIEFLRQLEDEMEKNREQKLPGYKRAGGAMMSSFKPGFK